MERVGTMTECFDKPVWTLGELARVLPGMPPHLLRVLPTALGKPIDGALRERVMLAVAAENQCRYCQIAHRVFGEAEGLAPAEIDRVIDGRDEELNARDAAAVAFVRDLARRDFESRDEALFDGLLEHFSEAERAAIESSAHVMNFANRFGNTFDAAFVRSAGGCDASQAGVASLAIVSGVFAAAAAVVAPVVGVVGLGQLLRKAAS